MYTMKQVCDELGLTYETLRFYCDEGLVPNVKRDENNYRQFDEKNIGWLKSLLCLRRCGMSVKDMKQYMELCLQGKSSIQQRIEVLDKLRQSLMAQIDEIQVNVDFIDTKQLFYSDVLSGRREYWSNLIDTGEA